MARNNKSVTVFQTDYDFRSRVNEKLKAIENKEIEQMNSQEMLDYLSMLVQGTNYIEKSNNIIKNTATKWEKKTAKGTYGEVNKVLNQLKEYDFYSMISGKKQSAKDMLNKTLKFNEINNMIHSEQKGGTTNESLYSFK